jgi:hypothetical protein
MKVVRLPSENGPDVWLVMHDLSVAEGRYRNFRPIHALTFLAQQRAKHNIKAFSLAMALENKLFGVRYFASQFREATTPTSESVYHGHNVVEYAPQQRVIASLEAYLSAIYSALEITSHLNKTFYPDLQRGFRRQSKKFKVFSFDRWKWIPHFLDLRTELTHFNTPLPIVSEQKIILEFTNPSDLEVFQKGHYEILIEDVCSYVPQLFNMLDAWAVEELQRIDPETEVQVVFEQGWKEPLKIQKVKIIEVLEQAMASRGTKPA